jgi:hypothetical protein
MIGFVFELDNLFEVYDILYGSKMKTCIHIYIYIYNLQNSHIILNGTMLC